MQQIKELSSAAGGRTVCRKGCALIRQLADYSRGAYAAQWRIQTGKKSLTIAPSPPVVVYCSRNILADRTFYDRLLLLNRIKVVNNCVNRLLQH